MTYLDAAVSLPAKCTGMIGNNIITFEGRHRDLTIQARAAVAEECAIARGTRASITVEDIATRETYANTKEPLKASLIGITSALCENCAVTTDCPLFQANLYREV